MPMNPKDVWMVDDTDVPNSYILYFIAVVVLVVFLLLAGQSHFKIAPRGGIGSHGPSRRV